MALHDIEAAAEPHGYAFILILVANCFDVARILRPRPDRTYTVCLLIPLVNTRPLRSERSTNRNDARNLLASVEMTQLVPRKLKMQSANIQATAMPTA